MLAMDGNEVDIGGKHLCFMCHRGPVKPPYIFWVGALDDPLVLHPACALDLMLRLGRDVWEAQCNGILPDAETSTLRVLGKPRKGR